CRRHGRGGCGGHRCRCAAPVAPSQRRSLPGGACASQPAPVPLAGLPAPGGWRGAAVRGPGAQGAAGVAPRGGAGPGEPGRAERGIWEIFRPGVRPGERYKYELAGKDGTLLPAKADPYAQQSELRPRTASIVADPTPFVWTDQAYMEARKSRDYRHEPMSVYEVHLGSWRRRPDGGFLS